MSRPAPRCVRETRARVARRRKLPKGNKRDTYWPKPSLLGCVFANPVPYVCAFSQIRACTVSKIDDKHYFRRNGASASAGTASVAHGASLAHARAAPPETIRRFSRREPTTRTSADRSDAARKSAPRPHFSWNPPSALPGGRKGPSPFFPTRFRDDARVTVSCAEGRGPGVSASSGASPAPTTSTELAGAVAGGGRSRRNAATARATSSSERSSASATGPRPGERVVFLSAFLSVPNAAASAAGE